MSGTAATVAAPRAGRRVLIPERIPRPPPAAALQSLVVRELGGATMGTTWCAKLAVPPAMELAPLARGIEAVLRRIVDEMSPWQPESHISRFNAAPAGSWHRLPDGFFTVLAAALDWARLTGGAYDPTIGAAVNLWGFGPAPARHAPPGRAAIAAARAPEGWQRLALDPERRRALQPGGLVLDLSSIAKGFAVDEVARFLRGEGIAGALVEIGGELAAWGVKPDGTPWWVAFETPRAAHASARALPETLLALAGLAVATSGDEQRWFEAGGRRYAHTLDPATGAPVAHDLVAVTVVAADAMTADAAATALMVLGPDAAARFAARHRLAARLVRFDGRRLCEHLSPALSAMLA